MFEPREILAEDHHELAEVQALQSTLNPLSAPPIPNRNPGFQLPPRIWGAMLASYVVFFAAIAAATGGSGHARFAIVVSILYTAMFFGLARVGAGVSGTEAASPLDRGEALQTWTGAMDRKSVFAQVLVVPVTLAIFGLGISTIAAFVL